MGLAECPLSLGPLAPPGPQAMRSSSGATTKPALLLRGPPHFQMASPEVLAMDVELRIIETETPSELWA